MPAVLQRAWSKILSQSNGSGPIAGGGEPPPRGDDMSYHRINDVHEWPFAGGIDAVCLSCGKRIYKEGTTNPTIACNVGFYSGATPLALCTDCVHAKSQGPLGILIGDAILAGLGFHPRGHRSLVLQLEDVLDRIKSSARYSIASGLQAKLEKR